MKTKFNEENFWDFEEVENRNLYSHRSNKFKNKDRIIIDYIKRLLDRRNQRFLIFRNFDKFLNKKITIKVLDIGFGDGRLLKKLSALENCECYGLDISKRNIEFTKKEIHNAKLLYGNITDMKPFDNDSFDVIIAAELLEHLTDYELKAGVGEVNRILKNDGVFILVTPLDEDLRLQLRKCPYCSKVFHISDHKQSFNEEKLNNLLNRHNFKPFKIVKLDDIPYYMPSNAEPFFKLWKRLWRIKEDAIIIFARKSVKNEI
jgi:SAM-dependent methyltransferase